MPEWHHKQLNILQGFGKEVVCDKEDEYKGYPNHLACNCGEGYLPELQEMERLIIGISL